MASYSNGAFNILVVTACMFEYGVLINNTSNLVRLDLPLQVVQVDVGAKDPIFKLDVNSCCVGTLSNTRTFVTDTLQVHESDPPTQLAGHDETLGAPLSQRTVILFCLLFEVLLELTRPSAWISTSVWHVSGTQTWEVLY